MRYVIRRARPDDLDKVIQLATDMVVHSVSPFRDISADQVKEFRRKDLQALAEAIKQPHVGLFIAEAENDRRFLGHVVVVCGYMESSTGESQGWVFDLSTVPDMWSQGIGRALMDQAEAFCIALGYKYLGLGVTTANDRAVTFYERLGFMEERKRMIKRLDVPEELLNVDPPRAVDAGEIGQTVVAPSEAP
ncbi:MAG: GNAT family N-acetyltransferase [Armatimonadetes bacterium]|nr:GNAT family N-acetyltransferase [Armatimonadota bacterium]